MQAGRAILNRAQSGESACFQPTRNEANPQIFLHKAHTGKKRQFLPMEINGLHKSKDLERVKGIEPSS
jgi:hypothetical protein